MTCSITNSCNKPQQSLETLGDTLKITWRPNVGHDHRVGHHSHRWTITSVLLLYYVNYLHLWQIWAENESIKTKEKQDARKKSVECWRRFSFTLCYLTVGICGRAVEHQTVNRGDSVSIPPAAISKHSQFCSPHIACLWFGRDIKKPVVPSIWCLWQGTKKIPHGGKSGTVVNSLMLEKHNSE